MESAEGEAEKGHRMAGVLVPVFAIRTENDLGIGDVRGVKAMIDWLDEMGMGFLQILPINETGRDNSPYNAISSIALDPVTLDTSPAGLEDLRQEQYFAITGSYNPKTLDTKAIDYPLVKRLKTDLLWAAFETFWTEHYGKSTARDHAFHQFCALERGWLGDYTLYRLLMDMEGGNEVWTSWADDYNTIEKARAFVATVIGIQEAQTEKQLAFYSYVQWVADVQWKRVRDYAESKGIELMGDMPFGVSYYSADVFCNPELFDLEWSGGAPPEKVFKDDVFTQEWGQNWGIPLYRWETLEERNYDWWKRRIGKLATIFSSFRIDHALGFYRIYSFPWRPERNEEFLGRSEDEARELTGGRLPGFYRRGDDTDEDRAFNRTAGEKLLRMVKEAAAGAEIIAEDLGHVPEYVDPSLESLEIPGMKVPQWQSENGQPRPGDEYPFLSMATYATHDHDPLRTQWKNLRHLAGAGGDPGEMEKARHDLHLLATFAGLEGDPMEINYTEHTREAFLRALFATQSKYASVMVTDLLGIEQRFNVPGVVGEDNWTARMEVSMEELQDHQKWRRIASRVSEILQATGRA